MKNLVNCIDDICDNEMINEESNYSRKNQNTKIKKMRNYKNY